MLSTRAIVGGWNAVNLTQYHNYYRLSLVSGLLELHLNKINMVSNYVTTHKTFLDFAENKKYILINLTKLVPVKKGLVDILTFLQNEEGLVYLYVD